MSAVHLTRQKDDAVRPALPSPADVEQIPLEQLPRLLGELEILKHVALARLVAPAASRARKADHGTG